MIIKKSYKSIVLLIITLLLASSCSTKKKSWLHRSYHNTNAKYNGYFNGKTSLNLGVKKLYESHVDDYTTVIGVFPTGDLDKKSISSYMDRAIQKGSIVIQRHSIKINGKEYCRWIDDNYLMVGRSYFYKGNFKEAIKTFGFVKNEYNDKDIKLEASLWLTRSYIEKKDFSSAASELEELLKIKKTPKKLKVELALVESDFYIKKKEFKNALLSLKRATKLIKGKRKKVRLNYILAQIYQYSNNYSLAQKHYEIVLASNPDYEMAFNAKMNLARSLESGNPDTKKMKDKLLKMVKDDKNKEYLDQIYYTIAEMEINNKDTINAIENYRLSAVNSIENNSQKALSFLALGKIFFNQNLYNLANTHYDSTVFYMSSDFRLYKESMERKLILNDLVYNINTIQMQDSLQVLGRLNKSEKQAVVQRIIQQEIEKENKIAQDKKIRQQLIYENAISQSRGEQFGSNTSGGQWYFYNPATLSFGMSEFRKKWGSRKIEDNWRRKDKKTLNNYEIDSSMVDSSLLTQNTKDPNYYLSKLPKTEEDYKASDSKIKEALYQLGVIYKEKIKDLNSSSNYFMMIFDRFSSDEQYASLALYCVYTNQVELNDKNSTNTKDSLLIKYPNSIYAMMITNPNYSSEFFFKKDTIEANYNNILNLYKKGFFTEVISKTNKPNNTIYKSKLLLLRAYSFIKTSNISKATTILGKISEKDSLVSKEAKYLLEVIKNPSNLDKANEMAIAESEYLFRSINKHIIILALPKDEVDITYLKTLVSDFHLNKIGNEVFEISALLMGSDYHLLIIKTFDNVNESMIYYDLFIEEKSVMDFLKKSEHKIMSISIENFQQFYNNKDLNGYYDFFSNNYLTNY